jgi:hypothetical protein
MINSLRDCSGILFRNDRKSAQKHPDYRGSATINGEEFWIGAWIKEGKKGKFLSLAFTAKTDQRVGEGAGRDVDLDGAFGRSS